MSAASPTTRHAPVWLIWGALATVYVVWGSTYLAIRLVVETMPPLLAGSARFLVAGLVLYAVLLVGRGPASLRLSRPQLAGSAFVALTLLLGGNGLVMLGERDVPSGLAALIIAVVPLWVVLLRLVFDERVPRGTFVSVVVGFVGVAILVLPGGLSGELALGGMLMLVGAAASWAVGSYASLRLELPADPFVATAAQLVLGGLGLAAAGTLAGEIGLVQPERFSTASLASFLYLIVFGSLLAYTAYTWLLQNAPVSQVATYAYVNPVVALVLGWVFLSEPITVSIVVGGALIIVAVGLVIRTESRTRRRARDAEATAGALAAPASASAVRREPERAAQTSARPR